MLLSHQAHELQQAIDAGKADRCDTLLEALAREHRVVGAVLASYLTPPAAAA